MGNGTISPYRADRIIRYLGLVQWEIRDAVNSPGSRETLNLREGGDLTSLLEKVKDEVNRRRAEEVDRG